MRGTFRRVGQALWLVLLVALALAGCAGGGGDNATQAGGSAAEAPAGEPVPPGEAGSGSTEGGDADDAAKDAGAQQQRVIPDERAIIYTAQLTVRVDDVSAAGQEAENIAAAAGGMVTEEQSDSSGGRSGATARLTIRVPPAEFRNVMGKLAGLGEKLSSTQSAADVTTQVVDVEARIESQRRSVARVRALLDRARNIGEVVNIESELASREADLDALLARQKQLSTQTDLATVTATLVGPAAEEPEDDPELGFLAGLRSGWEGFTTALAVMLTVFGAILPFLALVAVLWLPARWLLRRNRPVPTTFPAPAEPPRS
jgi:hypothetical protein